MFFVKTSLQELLNIQDEHFMIWRLWVQTPPEPVCCILKQFLFLTISLDAGKNKELYKFITLALIVGCLSLPN